MIIYIMEYDPVNKNNEIMSVMSLAIKWMKLDSNMSSEINQAQKTKYHMFLIIF
jgi:hypothetical protein